MAQFWMNCLTPAALTGAAATTDGDDGEPGNNAGADHQTSLFSVRVTVDRSHLLIEYPTVNLPPNLTPDSCLPPELRFHAYSHRIDLSRAAIHVLPEIVFAGAAEAAILICIEFGS